MAQPKISIIIPVYNAEAYLSMCLDTILKQTYPHFEILAVNDGSTDYSLKRLKEYAAQDARLRVFDQAQQGPAAARNVGLDHATGDYITFIDADDYVKENYLERLVTESQATQAEVTISDYYRYKEQTKMLYYYRTKEDYQVVALPLAELLQQMNKLEFTTVWGKLFQSSLFERVRFLAGHGYEDTMTVPKLYLQATKIVYVQEDLYCYRLTDDSVMSEYLTVTKIADLLRTIEENMLDLTLSGYDIQHQKQLYANYLATFAEYFESREMQTHPLYRKIKLRQFELGR